MLEECCIKYSCHVFQGGEYSNPHIYQINTSSEPLIIIADQTVFHNNIPDIINLLFYLYANIILFGGIIDMWKIMHTRSRCNNINYRELKT